MSRLRRSESIGSIANGLWGRLDRTGEVATMFRLNLRAMRADGRLEGFASATELDVIGRELDELARSKAEGEIVWYLRQTVFSPA